VLANTQNDQLASVYQEILNETLVDEIRQIHERPSKVVFARDTRASGPYLVKALKAALDVLSVEYKDYGILTTPQLHHMVRCINTAGTEYAYGEATEDGYYKKMAAAFKTVMYGRTIKGAITVDCANGVGGPKLNELIKYLPSSQDGGIDIKVVNDDVLKPEALNFEVSAGLRHGLVGANTAYSVVRTMSRPNSDLHQVRMLPRSSAAALSMVTLIALSTTISTKTKSSICLTATALRHLALSS
jgi:phosphomannomutase